MSNTKLDIVLCSKTDLFNNLRMTGAGFGMGVNLVGFPRAPIF